MVGELRIHPGMQEAADGEANDRHESKQATEVDLDAFQDTVFLRDSIENQNGTDSKEHRKKAAHFT